MWEGAVERSVSSEGMYVCMYVYERWEGEHLCEAMYMCMYVCVQVLGTEKFYPAHPPSVSLSRYLHINDARSNGVHPP